MKIGENHVRLNPVAYHNLPTPFDPVPTLKQGTSPGIYQERSPTGLEQHFQFVCKSFTEY